MDMARESVKSLPDLFIGYLSKSYKLSYPSVACKHLQPRQTQPNHEGKRTTVTTEWQIKGARIREI